MSQGNTTGIMRELTAFASRLTPYRRQVERYLRASPDFRRTIEVGLRVETQSMARQAGGVRPIVESVIGLRALILDNRTYDPWLEAFTSTYERAMLLPSLDSVTTAVENTIGFLQSKHLIDAITKPVQPQSIQRPKVFIAHDGQSELRDRLEIECWRNLLEPVVAEEQVSLNESVDTKVGRLLDGCQFAIVLARSERGVLQDNQTIPRGNIIDEIGRVRATLGDKYIILLERGLSLPTNLSTGVVWEAFDQTNFDGAILKVIRSLRAHRLL